MTRLLTFSLALATCVLASSALTGCDTSPTAQASAGAVDVETFVLRNDMAISANEERVVLVVGGQEIALRPVEMFALTLVAQRAAFDQFTPEQREIYGAGEPVYAGKGGGDECEVLPWIRRSASGTAERALQDGVVAAQPFVFKAPLGGGGGNPCPPPPVRLFTPELADLLFGDYFDIAAQPEDFEALPAAGGFNLYW